MNREKRSEIEWNEINFRIGFDGEKKNWKENKKSTHMVIKYLKVRASNEYVWNKLLKILGKKIESDFFGFEDFKFSLSLVPLKSRILIIYDCCLESCPAG